MWFLVISMFFVPGRKIIEQTRCISCVAFILWYIIFSDAIFSHTTKVWTSLSPSCFPNECNLLTLLQLLSSLPSFKVLIAWLSYCLAWSITFLHCQLYLNLHEEAFVIILCVIAYCTWEYHLNNPVCNWVYSFLLLNP